MNDEAKMGGEKYLILATFAGENRAQEILKTLEEYSSNKAFHDEVVVLTVDENGKVSVHGGNKEKKGLVSGSIVGLLVGALVGFPVVGVVLGGVLGHHRGKKSQTDLQDNVEENVWQSILDQMQPDSSLIVAEVDDWQAQNVADSLASYQAKQVLLGPADAVAAQIAGA